MDDTYSHYEFHDLPLMQVQAPVVTEAYHTIDELLNTPPQGNYSSIPTNQFQQPEKIRFYKYEYEPLLTSHDLRDVSDAEITPDSTGHIGHIMNSDNEKTPSPYEIKDHGNMIIPVSPANPRRKESEKTSRTVSPNIIKIYNAPQAKKFETGDTSTTTVKFTDQWKVDKAIMSQIHHQSSSPKGKKNCGKVSSSKKSQKMSVLKTKDKVQIKFTKDKPIILKSPPITPSVNMSIKYNILKSLVQSLEDLDNVLISKQENVHSKEMKTNNIMFNLSVEVARLAQEDHRRIIALCDPGKLKPSKL
jgi:hypothetical protein